jgi:hypothetical protein
MVNYIEKILKPLENVCGWVFNALAFALTFIGDNGKLLLGAVAVVVVIDIVFGTWVSLKNGHYFESKRLRESATKLFVYFGLQLIAIILDKVIGDDILICTRITTALIVVCELWSTLASVSIIYPHFPIGNLLKKYLVGEISKKLEIDEQTIISTLEEKEVSNENKGDK